MAPASRLVASRVSAVAVPNNSSAKPAKNPSPVNVFVQSIVNEYQPTSVNATERLSCRLMLRAFGLSLDNCAAPTGTTWMTIATAKAMKAAISRRSGLTRSRPIHKPTVPSPAAATIRGREAQGYEEPKAKTPQAKQTVTPRTQDFKIKPVSIQLARPSAVPRVLSGP